MRGFFQRPLLATKVIVRDQKGLILVVRRSITAPRRPLMWDFPGGIIDPGESPLEAAVRETEEEAGLEIDNVELVDVGNETDPHHVVLIFYAATVTDPKVKLSYEHDRFQWVDTAEFMKLKINDSFKDAVRALNKVK